MLNSRWSALSMHRGALQMRITIQPPFQITEFDFLRSA